MRCACLWIHRLSRVSQFQSLVYHSTARARRAEALPRARLPAPLSLSVRGASAGNDPSLLASCGLGRAGAVSALVRFCFCWAKQDGRGVQGLSSVGVSQKGRLSSVEVSQKGRLCRSRCHRGAYGGGVSEKGTAERCHGRVRRSVGCDSRVTRATEG